VTGHCAFGSVDRGLF